MRYIPNKMDIRFIGRKWKVSDGETLDGFKVISVELELATWENNEELWNYLSSVIFGGFLLPGTRIYEEELDKIINTLHETPHAIYTDLRQVEKDLVTFKNIRTWFKENYPHAWIEFDVGG